MIYILAVICIILLKLYLGERDTRIFWYKHWERESKLTLRLLGCQPKLRLVKGGKR